jgi:hypothetical protein
VVQLKINIQDAVESLLQSKRMVILCLSGASADLDADDLARAAGASIINVLVKHGTAPPYVLAGKALTDKVVPWVVKALEADDLTSFSCVTQLLRSFSHHGQLFHCTLRRISNIFQGRLGDIMSVPHQVSPSSVVSAIVRWFDRDIPKAFSVAIAALFAMVQPSKRNATCVSCSLLMTYQGMSARTLSETQFRTAFGIRMLFKCLSRRLSNLRTIGLSIMPSPLYNYLLTTVR